jgi:hypothetical protein
MKAGRLVGHNFKYSTMLDVSNGVQIARCVIEEVAALTRENDK